MILRRAISRLGNGPAPAPERPDGPDFLGIGMMKAATGWLYDQLQFHPDFWMPPFKEFHYFDKPFPSPAMLELRRAALEDLPGLNARRRGKTMRPLDARDLDFLDRVAACQGQPREVERYAGLFSPKGRLLTGDVTPAFSTLTAEQIAPLAGRFASTRAVLVVRDPVERMWSQITVTAMAKTGGIDALAEVESVRRLMRLVQVQSRSRPVEILGKWREAFGMDRVGVFFFEDVAERPQAAIADIVRFLGADPEKGGQAVPAGFNRKSSHPRAVMTPEIQRLLVDDLADELQRCAAVFGARGAAWLSRYRTA
jgi:hypothetical protein